MHFDYCPHCGRKTVLRKIGDEGLIPYCENCKIPLWDIFTSCIIAAVVNEYDEIALLRQNYVSQTKYVLVAGVIKAGESAEETVVREIKEELGLDVSSYEFIASYPYEKKDMLMLGFRARVKKAPLVLSGEVDSAEWVEFSDAPERLREGSIARRLAETVIKMSR